MIRNIKIKNISLFLILKFVFNLTTKNFTDLKPNKMFN